MKVVCDYTVRDLEDEDLLFVSDSQDVEWIKNMLGNNPEVEDFEAFFVKVKDGELKEIYGINSKIPYLNEVACKIIP